MARAENPYREGFDAYASGKKRNANPYHYQRPEHEQWDDGWEEARTRAEDNL